MLENITFELITPVKEAAETTAKDSRPEVVCKKDSLKNFKKFVIKHLCQSFFFFFFFDKVANLRPESLLKRGLWHRCFAVNFVKFLRTSFSIGHLLVAASEPPGRHAPNLSSMISELIYQRFTNYL